MTPEMYDGVAVILGGLACLTTLLVMALDARGRWVKRQREQ